MHHAASPLQLCPVVDRLQYYFIGPGGSALPGPVLPSFSELAAQYPNEPPSVVTLFSGTNPLTGKSARVDYLPAQKVIRVSTYYEDKYYKTDKPYTITVDKDGKVTYLAW